uniref:phage ORF5 protein n=2 Tax=Bacteroidota TaxID=976 RepID=UPI0040480DAA
MKMIVCSIRDRAAEAYGRPFFLPAVGVAIRSFQDEVNRRAEDNQVFQHPDDFDLFELGSFDDATGKFELHETPKQLALGKQLKDRE